MHRLSTDLSTDSHAEPRGRATDGPAPDLSRAMAGYLADLLLICGSGTGPALVALARAHPDPRAWRIVLERMRTRPDKISALGYTRRVLATALADVAALDAATIKPDRARRDLIDEIERERQALLDQVEREQYVAPPPPPPPAAGSPRREIPRGRRR